MLKILDEESFARPKLAYFSMGLTGCIILANFRFIA